MQTTRRNKGGRTNSFLTANLRCRSIALATVAGLLVLLATNLSFSQPQKTTVSISLSKTVITTGQSTVLTWSSAGASSCQGGGDPYIPGWSGVPQTTSGNYTVTQDSSPGTTAASYKSAGTYVYALTCTGNGSTASASATLVVSDPGNASKISEAITSLPADITPMLSVAGIWQPVANKYLRSDGNGTLANLFPQNIRLANRKEGLIITGWSLCTTPGTSVPITPVDIAVLEQQPDGTLQLATSKYVSNPQTNGGNNVLVADFNKDGIQDFFLPAHNESPFLPASSTAYISKSDGAYTKIAIRDSVEAHAATLAYINGAPTVFTGGYCANEDYSQCYPKVDVWNGAGFTVTTQTGMGPNASMAVGDFYGDNTYSQVYGDINNGINLSTGQNWLNGIYLWHLSNLLPVGKPVRLGDPYFNDKPQYAQYVSAMDPHGKTHCYRTWLDDFNHDGKLDIVVQGMIWNANDGQAKNILQMFQNAGNYQFTDVTDTLDPEYDQNSTQYEYVPQVRDIDGSGINSYLFGSDGDQRVNAPKGNYVLVNDGSGNLRVALHETLNKYAEQVSAWLSSNPSFAGVGPENHPRLRAYLTPDGKMNFAAIVWIRTNSQDTPRVEKYVIVNIPLRLDLPSLLTKAMVVRNRNGSHLIRTFAGDDTIYSGNNGGFSKVDGGAGTNTVVYSGPSKNYSGIHNADGTWTINDNVGEDGTDTLKRIQRLRFTDVTLDQPFALASPTPSTTKPLNISTRMEVLTNDNVLIAGFIVTGIPGAKKKVMIRGLGPSLAKAGVPNPLVDPLLELHDGTGALLASNDNWQQASNAGDIPTGFQPTDARESVIVATLTIGSQGFAKFTAGMRGAHAETGVGLVEAYDLQAGTNHFANISTRGFVDAGANVMIGGFILGGSAQGSKVLIRAIGPSLTGQGVSGALADPTLEIHDGQGTKIRSNDNWKIDDATGQSQEAAITATTIPPANDLESAILNTFAPGAYTAIVAGKSGGTGVGLVEVYNLK